MILKFFLILNAKLETQKCNQTYPKWFFPRIWQLHLEQGAVVGAFTLFLVQRISDISTEMVCYSLCIKCSVNNLVNMLANFTGVFA